MSTLASPVARAEPILSLTNIGKHFGAFTALEGVSLDLMPGDVHCLLGENGAGKSTLCNVIFGVHQPDSGEIRLDDRPFRPSGPADSLAAGIAMVHQHFSVIGTMTVVDNLMMGQTSGRLRRTVFAERVRELSRTYDLAVDPDRLVDDLS